MAGGAPHAVPVLVEFTVMDTYGRLNGQFGDSILIAIIEAGSTWS